MSAIYKATDLEFDEWQTKIKRHFNDFRISVDQLKDSPTRISYVDIFDKDINDLDDQIDNKDAIGIMIQEIKYLEEDLENIISLISIPKFKNNPRVSVMAKKLQNVKKSICSMKKRAKLIQNQYSD